MTLQCACPPATAADGRRVVLLKSLATNNRFYALVPSELGLHNADTVADFPPGILLGVAYPCLEDGLNDFAVVRTTFETLDYYPNDAEMRREMMEIIDEARGKLARRLVELRDRVAERTAHFLGTDLEEFRSYAQDMMFRGYPRRNLDSMMKLNVFASVAEHERRDNGPDPLYYYRPRPEAVATLEAAESARQFVAAMFDDILRSVEDDANYRSRHIFDREVFQKFIAMMFVNYATTDPIFYGTHKADYGVSGDREMDETPLYVAVSRQLREIEARYATMAADAAPAGAAHHELDDTMDAELPGPPANEDAVLGPIASICAVAKRLTRFDDHEVPEMARVILTDASILVQELKRRGVLSAVAYDPSANGLGAPR